MAYATRADIIALAPHLNNGADFSGTTRPTAAQVDTMIADVERLLDATLENQGYSVPITGTKSVQIARDISAHGALARVLRARAYASSSAPTALGEEAQKFFDMWIKRLGDDKDPFELPDAPRTDEQVEKDMGNIVESQVQGLDTSEFDADHPSITRNQVF